MSEQPQISEGQPTRSGEFAGNRKRLRGAPIPALQFGEHGELTPRTIEQANLTAAEKERAYEMMRLQAVFLDILDTMSYPVDPDGHVHDLSAMGPTKIAIAWTLALNGFRRSDPPHIKKRSFNAPGVYQDAHTWVDVRAADDAATELRPEHRADNHKLPPDTRRLAALRDDAPPMQLPPEWKVTPKIVFENTPRRQR